MRLASVPLALDPVPSVARERVNARRDSGADQRTRRGAERGGVPLIEREVYGEQARANIYTQSRTDPRYGSRRWRKTAQAVLIRDNHVCRIVEGCVVRATVADHIVPTYPGMPNSLFFGMTNLRAGCQGHNKARGMAPDVPPRPTETAVVTKDYSRGAG
jgi:5-methylcytosine-specific restriction endonuclease McrA